MLVCDVFVVFCSECYLCVDDGLLLELCYLVIGFFEMGDG